MDPKEAPTKESVVEFEEHKEFNLAGLLVWLGFVLSLVFLVFFWFSKSGMESVVKEETAKKTELINEISSERFVEVEERAVAAEIAVDTLDTISNEKIKTKDFLDELYKSITKDTKLSSISIGSDKTIALDGSTATYRQVADFMLGLQSFDRISETKLVSVSASLEDVNANESVVFSVSGKVDLKKSASTSE